MNKPFINIDIRRGQSRGLKKSWFSFFSSDKEDESGEVTNEKVVGQFKGRIKVFNPEDEEAYKRERKENNKEIFRLLNEISMKVLSMPIIEDLKNVASQEQLATLQVKLEELNIEDDQLLEFIKDSQYEKILRK